MACLDASLVLGSHERAAVRRRAEAMLADHGTSVDTVPGAAGAPENQRLAATGTALMELFRTSGEAAVFEALIDLVAPQLYARVRSRLRFLGAQVDPHEVLQDAIINIYRYPDRFDACRPGAFAAWSSTIVDNTIRRQLRRNRSGPDVSLRSAEMLMQEPDAHVREPAQQAEDQEECRSALSAFRLVLAFYLAAYQTLSERERFVLQMVEVRAMRYSELASLLAIRPEALKMVVFRARKRIHDRMAQFLGGRAVDPTLAIAC